MDMLLLCGKIGMAFYLPILLRFYHLFNRFIKKILIKFAIQD